MTNASQQQTHHANSEMITYWNDVGGPKWVRYQAMLDRQLDAIGNAAITASRIYVGASVLDVGCGCGSTTIEIARRVGLPGRCVGIDISAPMLELAKQRVHEMAVPNASFLLADAQTHEFKPEFDIVFSRFGVMFFDDPVSAFTNLHKALHLRNGRIVFVCWQAMHRNPWMSLPMMAAFQHVKVEAPGPDAPGPFAFADAGRVESILKAAGFHDPALSGLDVDLTIGGGADLDATVDFLMDMGPLGRALGDATPDVRAAVMRDVRATVEGYATSDGVRMGGAVWIVTANV